MVDGGGGSHMAIFGEPWDDVTYSTPMKRTIVLAVIIFDLGRGKAIVYRLVRHMH